MKPTHIGHLSPALGGCVGATTTTNPCTGPMTSATPVWELPLTVNPFSETAIVRRIRRMVPWWSWSPEPSLP